MLLARVLICSCEEEEIVVILEIGIMSLCVLAALIVVTIFFCNVEAGPIAARKTATSARFAGLNDGVKRVRFW